MVLTRKTKIKKALILVELDDHKVYQINSTVEENGVLLNLLKTMQGGSIEINPDPIDGIELNLSEEK